MELRELMAKLYRLRAEVGSSESDRADIAAQIASLEAEIRLRLDASDEAFSDLSEQDFQALMSDLGDPKQVTVEVVYATSVEQAIHEVQIAQGASVEDCIAMSGILDSCPDIDLSVNKVGINGAVKPLSERVAESDRIEIYRPVTAEV